jgi:hypothetical protein
MIGRTASNAKEAVQHGETFHAVASASNAVTASNAGAKLTPELETRFLNLKLLKQVDRTKLPNLVKAAKNGDTAALEQLYELETATQAEVPVKARA